MKTTSSARRAVWPRLCETSSTLQPLARMSRISCSTWSVADGSRLAVGSSSSSSRGSVSQARASASRWRSPPDSLCAGAPGRIGHEQQVVQRRPAKERRVLEDQRLSLEREPLVGRRAAFEAHLARVGFEQAVDRAQHHRLPGAVGADQRAGAHAVAPFEVDRVEHRPSVRAERDRAQAQQRLSCHSGASPRRARRWRPGSARARGPSARCPAQSTAPGRPC